LVVTAKAGLMVIEPGMAAGCVPEVEALGVVALAVSFSVIEKA
jgi:hypothetical protein